MYISCPEGNSFPAIGHKLLMQELRPRQSFLFALTLFSSVLLGAQQQSVRAQSAVSPQMAQGDLVVMCTVTASVALVLGPDRAPHLVQANAVDPADNISHLQYFAAKPVKRKRFQRTRKQSGTCRAMLGMRGSLTFRYYSSVSAQQTAFPVARHRAPGHVPVAVPQGQSLRSAQPLPSANTLAADRCRT
jgi:hypothetical protein